MQSTRYIPAETLHLNGLFFSFFIQKIKCILILIDLGKFIFILFLFIFCNEQA